MVKLKKYNSQPPSNPKVDGMNQHSFTVLMKNLTDFTESTNEFIFFKVGHSVIGYLKIMLDWPRKYSNKLNIYMIKAVSHFSL